MKKLRFKTLLEPGEVSEALALSVKLRENFPRKKISNQDFKNPEVM